MAGMPLDFLNFRHQGNQEHSSQPSAEANVGASVPLVLPRYRRCRTGVDARAYIKIYLPMVKTTRKRARPLII
jgi:hypothetical protein